ncbi:MAG: type I-B CRISPR-associated protein Cas7/Cst2/DevR [Candidatus Woesearchaeota archaeon]
MSKFLVFDIVFYGTSLNYDGNSVGNTLELKKITKWDGKPYVLVSRYALRYSLLTWANQMYPDVFKLAGADVLTTEKTTPQLKNINKQIFEEYPEFDLFGFMITSTKSKKDEKSESKNLDVNVSRTSPVKISHAVSLTPHHFDNHLSANLDMMKRAKGQLGQGSNLVNVEEKSDFYLYNVTFDVDRIGKYTKEEHGSEIIGDIILDREKIIQRIELFVKTIFFAKRQIKGRLEDLSPVLAVVGLYNNGMYDSYLNRISLSQSKKYKVKTIEYENTDQSGRKIREIENIFDQEERPKFIIYGNELNVVNEKEEIFKEVHNFLVSETTSKILVYKNPNLEVEFRK